MAQLTTCVREENSNLERMLLTCEATVYSLSTSVWAMSRLDLPCATRANVVAMNDHILFAC